MNKKENFKILIKEFHNEPFPYALSRDLEVPLFPKKIISIYGPRRTGKTFYLYTLMKKLIDKNIPKDKILYLNFEDDRILPLNLQDLNLLLEAYFELYPENKTKELFFFFDEIQNIKNWEIFVRRIYDREKAKIFITGSSSKLLSKEITTALRGRTLSFALYSLNFKEFLRFKGVELERDFEYTSQRFIIKKLLEEYLEWGGFPEVVLENDTILKKKILKEYFNFLVYRDLVDRFSIANTTLLKDILKFLFTNIISYFSINSYYKTIKQSKAVSRETISIYLSFIQETDYFFLLPKFSYSLKAQEINPKKIICLDNGLRNTASFRFSNDYGKLAENLVGNILKRENEEVFYWHNKKEVDFIVKENRSLLAFNVAFAEEIKEREINSLREFKNKYNNVKEVILITKDIEKKVKEIKLIPLWKWLLKSKI